VGCGVDSQAGTIHAPFLLCGVPQLDAAAAAAEAAATCEGIIAKLHVEQLPPALAGGPLAGRHVFLGAATQHAEQLYGQTNCWVAPDVLYGAYELPNGEVLVCLPEAAEGLRRQGWEGKGGRREARGATTPVPLVMPCAHGRCCHPRWH